VLSVRHETVLNQEREGEAMPEHVCPWWLGYLLANPLRRLIQDPLRILEPHVRSGMTVLEPGPGMGFFTLELARQVGGDGRVIAVDVQLRMLERLKRRAAKDGLLNRIDARHAQSGTMGIQDLDGQVDFVLAFAVVHEIPSASGFFAEAASALKPEGKLLLAEPMGHVNREQFEQQVRVAFEAGLRLVDHPSIRRSHAALLFKG
jgi:ubiquinone/menaquinone biosynthesis C-methylase UbiE